MNNREGLEFLRRHASNAPAGAPTSRVPSNRNQQIVAAIAQGIGPVIREQLDALRAEIADKNARIAEQEARLKVLEYVHTEIAVVKAALGTLRLELADAMETADPARRYSGVAVPRLLS